MNALVRTVSTHVVGTISSFAFGAFVTALAFILAEAVPPVLSVGTDTLVSIALERLALFVRVTVGAFRFAKTFGHRPATAVTALALVTEAGDAVVAGPARSTLFSEAFFPIKFVDTAAHPAILGATFRRREAGGTFFLSVITGRGANN